MTWAMETSQGFESDKIAAFVVPYLQGKFLDLGCGMRTVWPSAIGMDSGHHFGPHSTGIRGDVRDLSMFKDESMDGIFSSHTLEHFPRDEVPAVLREWARVLKVGGHMVLYLPSKNLYPNIGQPGGNPDHKWDILPGDIETMFQHMAAGGSKAQRVGWTLLESEERGGTNEYSLYIVVRKEKAGWTEKVWQRNPEGKKRVLVVRFGAIGDQIVASSILPGLHKQGYHITYMTTPEAQQVVQHDPYVDEWWVQGTDYVPNTSLGPYWDTLKTRFDKVINLSESIEGALLTLPGRLQHQYPEETRRKLYGTVNYLERTHDIAGVPYDFAPAFYPTKAEDAAAEALIRSCAGGGPVVLWSVHGSSAHKIYPWTHLVVRWLVEKQGAHVFLNGDPVQGKELCAGMMQALVRDGVDTSHIHVMAGRWQIREALTFAQHCNVVVGPETGVLNSVAFLDVPKVIYLSHSTHENLTKHWCNTAVLLPDEQRCPCYPCLRLHYGWEHCNLNEETKAAQCASSIPPEAIFEAIMHQIGLRKAA